MGAISSHSEPRVNLSHSVPPFDGAPFLATRLETDLCNVTLQSETLQRSVRLRVSAHALRSVEHRGGLDAFLAKASASELSSTALTVKREIEKKLAAAS